MYIYKYVTSEKTEQLNYCHQCCLSHHWLVIDGRTLLFIPHYMLSKRPK